MMCNKIAGFYLVCIVLFFIIGISCTPDKPSIKYFPNKKGMKWEYQVTTNKPVGLTVMKKGEATNTNINARDWKSTETVEAEEIIGGKKYFKVVRTFSGLAGFDPIISYRRFANDGIYLMQEGSKEYLGIPFPIPDKKSWEFFNPDRLTTSKCYAEKVDKVYTSGATYKDGLIIACEYHLPVNNCDYKVTSYYVANIGLVRSISYNKTQNINMESNLIRNK